MKLILDHNPDINRVDKFGRAPLHHAARASNESAWAQNRRVEISLY